MAVVRERDTSEGVRLADDPDLAAFLETFKTPSLLNRWRQKDWTVGAALCLDSGVSSQELKAQSQEVARAWVWASGAEWERVGNYGPKPNSRQADLAILLVEESIRLGADYRLTPQDFDLTECPPWRLFLRRPSAQFPPLVMKEDCLKEGFVPYEDTEVKLQATSSQIEEALKNLLGPNPWRYCPLVLYPDLRQKVVLPPSLMEEVKKVLPPKRRIDYWPPFPLDKRQLEKEYLGLLNAYPKASWPKMDESSQQEVWQRIKRGRAASERILAGGLDPQELTQTEAETCSGMAASWFFGIANLGLVREAIAREKPWLRGRMPEMSHLLTIGIVHGIFPGLETYDPGRHEFSTYFMPAIRRAVRHYDKESNWLNFPSWLQDKMRAVALVSGRFQAENGREPSSQEIANETGMRLKTVEKALAALQTQDILYLQPRDCLNDDYEEEKDKRLARRAEERPTEELYLALARDERQAIMAFLETLPPSIRRVFFDHYGLKSGQGKTYEEIAREQGCQTRQAAKISETRGRPRLIPFLLALKMAPDQLADIIDGLPLPQKVYLRLRLGLFDGKPKTPEEIAQRMGKKPSQMRSLEKRAFSNAGFSAA